MSLHTVIPLQMPGSPQSWQLAACPVLQATVVLQELTSSEASSTTQAFSCRSRLVRSPACPYRSEWRSAPWGPALSQPL